MEGVFMILIGICVFMFSVYFTRWVFGIDKIIELQKEQSKSLKEIQEILQEKIYSDDAEKNKLNEKK